jgi:uncharacterized membrane protein YedE/YeeE
MNWIYEPWPWYTSGAAIALVMWIMLYFGKNFGFSNNLRTLCTMCGADKFAPFFQFDWQTQSWNLMFLIGTGVGGWIAATYLSAPDYTVLISDATISDLSELGFSTDGFVPASQFGWEAMHEWKNLAILIAGGLMVGFGARWAGGCTSGHAISGLSDLQPASLLAVVGFFIGGLLMTHVLFPLIY